MTKMDFRRTNGAYVKDTDGYTIAKAKYSEMVCEYGLRGVRLHTTEDRIEVTKTKED